MPPIRSNERILRFFFEFVALDKDNEPVLATDMLKNVTCSHCNEIPEFSNLNAYEWLTRTLLRLLHSVLRNLEAFLAHFPPSRSWMGAYAYRTY